MRKEDNKITGPLSTVVTAILLAFGLPSLNIRAAEALAERRDESLRMDLQRLAAIAQNVGFDSVYILVDRVDEIGLTSTDASKTLQFIQSLATDLPTLELPGIAFKFFLWDLIEEDLRARLAKPIEVD